MKIEAIVIGVSAGGLKALPVLLEKMPQDFQIPILIVQHLSPLSDETWIRSLDEKCLIRIKEAEDKEEIKGGFAYIAPPDYHLMVESDGTAALSVDEKVNYSRPSIDILFETASDLYREKLIGIILTGSNSDGAKGLSKIEKNGGTVIIQDPLTSEYPQMPQEAIKAVNNKKILSLKEIADFLLFVNNNKRKPSP